MFDDLSNVFVIDSLDTEKGKMDKKEMIFGIVTRIDLLNFITLNLKTEAGHHNGNV